MAIHIGQIIKKRSKEKRISATELAGIINTSKQNVYGIFKRNSVDTEQLLKLSNALDHNLFQYYIDEFEKKTAKGKIRKSEDTMLENCKKELKSAKKEIEYLEEINQLLKSKTRLSD